MTFRTCIALAATALLASCASTYKPETSGPVAQMRFTDRMPKDILGKRGSGVFFYKDAQCQALEGVSTDDWISVPAGRVLTFRQFVNATGYSNGSCGVWARVQLQEGQRVEVQYENDNTGGRFRCTIVASEISDKGATLRPFPLEQITGKECRTP